MGREGRGEVSCQFALAIRTLLVEDHPTMLAGVSTLLSLEDDIEVIGEAKDEYEALEKTRSLAPDVIVLDLRLKGENSGIELCREMKSLAEPPYVVVHTAYNAREDLASCYISGAESYVHKGEPSEKLITAIRETAKGRRMWFIGGEEEEAASDAQKETKLIELTRREREILALVVKGYTNPQIAEELSISVPTVKTHVSSVLKKRNAASRYDLR